VKEKMNKQMFNLGGEQSGHIILGDFATTGDGLLVSLEVLHLLKKATKASKLLDVFKKTPQVLENIKVKDKTIVDEPRVRKEIDTLGKALNSNSRLLVRKSGTENVIRIMVESIDKKILSSTVNKVKSILQKYN